MVVRLPTTGVTEKFTGYFRDAETGNDYAINRYMTPSSGRFMTPDPSGARAANPANPQSWNQYAYAKGDPINHHDPRGLDDDDDDDDGACLKTSTCGECFDPSGLIYQPGPDCSGGDDDDDNDSGPTCTIQMFTRQLSGVKGGFLHFLATHSYLVITMTNSDGTIKTETFDGQHVKAGNLLKGEAVTPGYGDGNNPGAGWTDSSDGPPMQIPCSDMGVLEQATTTFDAGPSITYHNTGPNSNSYLHWLLGQIGLGSTFAWPPGGWGWYVPIPGYSGF